MTDKAPRIYDVTIDESRPATQADIAIFEATARAYGNLRKMIETEHARLMAEVRGIRSRAGLPHE